MQSNRKRGYMHLQLRIQISLASWAFIWKRKSYIDRGTHHIVCYVGTPEQKFPINWS